MLAWAPTLEHSPMTTVATAYRHVELDERGVPLIAGTRFKVALLI